MPTQHILVDWFPQGVEHTPADEIEQHRASWFAEAFCEECEEGAKQDEALLGRPYLESRPLSGAYQLTLGGITTYACLMHLQLDDYVAVCP
jgi:hypothetical protein